MAGPALVVIGASQGGVEALRRIAAGLDARAPAIWCVVLHTDAHASYLPEILERAGPLPARHAVQGQRLQHGRIYIAPPDHHFLVRDGAAFLSRGPRVNHTRPAVDPLFRSAAEDGGARTIGVVLTGNLSDGALGLREIRRRGGVAVIQDPMEAESPGMPSSALAHAGADHCVTLARMPALLCRLAAEVAGAEAEDGAVPAEGSGLTPRDETSRPRSEAPMHPDAYRLDRPSTISCPDCGGALSRESAGATALYRCHIGHVLTIETLLHVKDHVLEEKLGACLALLNERAELCRLMSEAAQREGSDGSRFGASRSVSLDRAQIVRGLLESEWGHPEEGSERLGSGA